MSLHERRIVGPPGCGKTTEVARQVRQIVEARGQESVLVMSFTNAAAKAAVGHDLPIADERVGTIHALCYRALDRPTLAVSKLKDWNAAFPQWALAGGQDLSEPGGGGRGGCDGDPLFLEMQRYRAMRRPASVWPPRIALFAEAYEGWKKQVGVVDFTDLLEMALVDLPTPPLGAQIIMLDEAQDCTPLQWQVVRQWAESCEYFYSVGDLDQLLYGWMGAVVDSMMVPVEAEKLLDQSYRVPEAVVEISQAWIEQASRRAPTVYKPRAERGYVERSLASWKRPEDLVEAIANLPEDETAMILGATGYMLSPTITMLRENGIAFGNRYSRRRGDWNPLTPGRGTSMSERLLAFLRPRWPEGGRFWTLDDVQMFTQPMRARDCLLRGAKKKLLEIPADERRETEADISWLLANVFPEQVFSALFDCDVEAWLGLLLKDKARPARFPAAIYARSGVRGLMAQPLVTVGTIHSVKGGEADHVFLFPDLSLAAYRQWRQTGEPRDSVIRQFYVGMTRARQGLSICRPVSASHVPI